MPRKTTYNDNLVYARIRMVRLMHGKSREWLAERLDIAVEALVDIEGGTVEARPSLIYQISTILDVRFEVFFEDVSEIKVRRTLTILQGIEAAEKQRR